MGRQRLAAVETVVQANWVWFAATVLPIEEEAVMPTQVAAAADVVVVVVAKWAAAALAAEAAQTTVALDVGTAAAVPTVVVSARFAVVGELTIEVAEVAEVAACGAE